MSRIGLKPIPLPAKVEVEVDASNEVVVKARRESFARTSPVKLTLKTEDAN